MLSVADAIKLKFISLHFEFIFRFAKIPITTSAPIVPFRETIVLPPKVDAVNEEITDINQRLKVEEEEEQDEEVLSTKAVRVPTPNDLCTLQIRACPLPEDIVKLIDKHADIILTLEKTFTAWYSDKSDSSLRLTVEVTRSLLDLKTKMDTVFKDSGKKWRGAIDQIWSC